MTDLDEPNERHQPMNDHDLARLELNARGYQYDRVLDHAADLFDNDPAAWQQLPIQVQDLSGIYRALRDNHRRAVRAGAIEGDQR